MAEAMYPDIPTLEPLFEEQREKAKSQRTREIAKAMLKEGVAIETIIKVTSLSKEELDKIKG